MSGTIVVSLQFFSGDLGDENCYLYTHFVALEPGPLPFLPANFDPFNAPLPFTRDEFLEKVNAFIAGLIPDTKTPVPIFGKLPGHPARTNLANAGVSVDGLMKRIAFRVQIPVPGTDADVPWTNFFSGYVADRLDGSQWSLWVDRGYIESSVQAQVRDALSGVKVDDLETYVGAQYSNAGGTALITATIEGVYDLPDPLGTIDVNLSIPTIVSVPTTDVLQLDIKLPELKDLAAQISAPFLSLAQIFLGPLGVLLAAGVHSLIEDIKEPAYPSGCNRTTPNDIVCKIGIPRPTLGNLVPHVQTLLALDDGISLAGTIYEFPLTQPKLDVTVREFTFKPPHINCGPAGTELVALFAESPNSFDILHATVSLENSGTVPMYLCGVTVINDPLNVFPAGSIAPDSQVGPVISFTVHPPIPGPAYYASPYPCDLLISTTAGTRLARIPPLPHLDQHTIDNLKVALFAELVACEKLVDQWYHGHRLNPHWLVDPPFDRVVEHIWEVEVHGLPAGETVSLVDSRGRELVQARARGNTPARVSALLQPLLEAGGNELSIVRGTGGQIQAPAEVFRTEESRSTGKSPTRGIAIVQRLMIRLGSIPLPQPCLRLQTATVQGKRCLLAVMKDSVTAFDLSNPQMPVITGSWGKPGIRGALSLDGQLILFGEDGFEAIDAGGGRTSGPDACAAEIEAAAYVGGYVYAIAPGQLKVYSRRLCGVASIRVERASSILLAGGRLVVASHNRISLCNYLHPRSPQIEDRHLQLQHSVVRLARPFAAEPGSFLAVLEDGSALSIAVTEQGFEHLARFENKPWTLDCVRIGTALVNIAKGGSALNVSIFGRSR